MGLAVTDEGTSASGTVVGDRRRAIGSHNIGVEIHKTNGRMLPRLYIPEGGTSLEEVERSMVELAMRQANSNQTQAARLLDISRDALRYKLKKFGLMHGEEEETAHQSSPDSSSRR